MDIGDNTPPPLTYADDRTDVDRAFYSLDRAMTARLARVLGISLFTFGIILTLMVCMGLSNMRNSNAMVIIPLITLGMYVVPGIALASASRAVDDGGRTSRIVVLIATIWVLLALGFLSIVSIAQISFARSPNAEYVQLIADVVLIIAAGKLLYHVIRLITFGELRGERAEAILGVRERLSLRWLDAENGRDQTIRSLGILRIGIGSLLVILSVCCTVAAIPGREPPSPPIILTVPSPIPSTPKPTTPFSGDLYAAEGLPAAERKAAIEGLDRDKSMSEERRLATDVALRHMGLTLFAGIPRPLTPESISAALFTPKEYRPTQRKIRDSDLHRFLVSGYDLRYLPPGDPWTLVITQMHAPSIYGRPMANVQPTFWYDFRVPGLLKVEWNLAYINHKLERINQNANGKLTQQQADKVVELLKDDYVQSGWPSTADDPLKFLEVRNDGIVKVRYNSNTRDHPRLSTLPQKFSFQSPDLWIDPAGEINEKSPEMIAADAAAVITAQRQAIEAARAAQRAKREARRLHASPLAITSVFLAGVVSLLLGQAILKRRAGQATPMWPVTFGSSLLATGLGIAAFLWLIASMYAREPRFAAMNGLSLGIFTIVCWVGYAIVCDVILPLRLSKIPQPVLTALPAT